MDILKFLDRCIISLVAVQQLDNDNIKFSLLSLHLIQHTLSINFDICIIEFFENVENRSYKKITGITYWWLLYKVSLYI